MNPTIRRTIAVLAVIAAFAGAAQCRAEDNFAPCWRGSAGTTYQNWGFSDSNNPAIPESFTNFAGTAQAAMTPGTFGTGWKATTLSRSGAWDLGQGGHATVTLPDLAGSPAWKYVQVQVTYFDAPGFYSPPIVSIAGATLLNSQVASNQTVGPGVWRTQQTLWSIQPSPSSETIQFAGDPLKGLVIDQIIVDSEIVVASCHPAIINLDASGHAVITFASVDSGSTSNCDIASRTVSPNSFTCANLGTNNVLLTVTDVHSNAVTCSTTVAVRDLLPPVINVCPTNRTVSGCHASVPNLVSETVVTDNCPGGLVITQSPPAGATLASSQTTVLITATDAAGNSANCNVVLTVAPASLSISSAGQNVMLTWPSGWTLYQSVDLMGPWAAVSGASSPYAVPQPLASQQFYRLQCY